MKIVTILLTAVICLFTGSAFAFTMNVDGELTEWGVTPGYYGNTNWTPGTGIAHNDEDNDPSIFWGYVNPGWGGQYFDVEAMYVTSDAQNVYFAVVTGFYPGVINGYRPGDIAFDFGADGSYEFGLAAKTRAGFVQGNLYGVSGMADWNKGLWENKDPLSDPTDMNNGAYEYGDGTSSNFAYNGNYYFANDLLHYVMEGYVPISEFGGRWGEDVRVHWAMSCGNDYLNVDYTPESTPVPEPATLALFGLGLAGLLRFRKRKM